MQLNELIGIYTFIGTLGFWDMFILVITILLFSSLWIKKSVHEAGLKAKTQLVILIISLISMLSFVLWLGYKSDYEQNNRALATRIRTITTAKLIAKNWERISFSDLAKEPLIAELFEGKTSTEEEIKSVTDLYSLEFCPVLLEPRKSKSEPNKWDSTGIRLIDLATIGYIKREIEKKEREKVDLLKSILKQKGGILSFDYLFKDYRFNLYSGIEKYLKEKEKEEELKDLIRDLVLRHGTEIILINNIEQDSLLVEGLKLYSK